jgi:hypothetical protein
MIILEVRLAHNNILKLLSIPDEGYFRGVSCKHNNMFLLLKCIPIIFPTLLPITIL